MTNDPCLIDHILGGRYRVIRQLGKGGMGTVYEAENTWIKRRVALKVLDRAVAADEAFVRRFMQEAETAAQLRHPNVVDVLDLGQDARTGAVFIVYELLVGRDLRKRLRAEGPLPAAEALAVIAPVMEALVLAHARGVVHRDLKPDNIFLAETPGGVVSKLIDFGVARVTSDEGVSLQNTHAGAAIGTPYYMSPEHWRAEEAVDARADVWSLGVVLYEVLAGERPFRGRSSGALIAKILYEAPTALAELAPDAPPALADAVMRALQKDREARHPTMQAFLDAVRAASTGAQATSAKATSAVRCEPSAPAPSGASATFAPMETPPAVTPAPVRRPPPARRRVVPRAASAVVTPSNGIEVL